MDATIVIVGAVGLVGLALVVGLIFWMTRARVGEAVAEQESKALREGQKRRQHGDKILAESVADESAWLRRTRDRLRRRRGEP